LRYYGQHLQEIVRISATPQSFRLDAYFEGFFLLEQVKRQMPDNGKILRRIVLPNPTMIFIEGNI
jgi:hypothetical protein